MWYLITISCATLLSCQHVQLDKKAYRTLAECEAAMEKIIEKQEPLEGVMCYKKESDIQT